MSCNDYTLVTRNSQKIELEYRCKSHQKLVAKGLVYKKEKLDVNQLPLFNKKLFICIKRYSLENRELVTKHKKLRKHELLFKTNTIKIGSLDYLKQT